MQRWLWLALACAACTPEHLSAPAAASADPSAASPAPAAASATPRRVANLHAFARLYGVVRWFYPGDAAAEVDWDRFAIDGAHRVADAADRAELRATLTELFARVAPTVRIAGPGEALVDDPALHPASTAGLDVVAWEHSGYGDSELVSAYQSKRRHRARTVPAAGDPFAELAQSIDATPYRGARVRLRAKIRADVAGGGQLWLRVDRVDRNAQGFFDNMEDRAVTAPEWTDAEIIGTIDADATSIVYGVLVSGTRGASFDDVELAIQDAHGAWQPIATADAGFEDADPRKTWHAGKVAGWDITSTHDRPSHGAAALHIAQSTTEITDELFADAPKPSETVDIDLGSGLRARVPIALYSQHGHTVGDPAGPPASSPPVAAPPPTAGYDAIAGAADVIVAWNVIEHFWPYWDDVPLDWSRELDVALGEALADKGADDHVATLERLAAAAPDGHAGVTCPGQTPEVLPPVTLAWIEEHAVVTASADPHIAIGDVVTAVDGTPIPAVIASAESRTSGSPQWKRVRAMAELLGGRDGSTVTLHVQHTTGETDVALPRTSREPSAPPAHPAIEHRPDGVWYVDLGRAELADIDKVMPGLAAAPGVVLDMRGYPNGTHPVLSHLLAKDEHARWMWIPKIVRPDHASHAWDGMGWDLPALAPHIAGKVAVLTGPRAISYAESVMGFVEAEHLGAIVGGATAGTNGNVAAIHEPTGCRSTFTGMRVTRHDGSRHHLLGVAPTVPVTRTIAGVRAGRDEVLDAALAWIHR